MTTYQQSDPQNGKEEVDSIAKIHSTKKKEREMFAIFPLNENKKKECV